MLLTAAAAIGLLAAFLATRSYGAGAMRTQHVVMTAKNAKLGKIVLVTRGGSTLYSLSAERHGRFISTSSACLSFWKPLLVPKGPSRLVRPASAQSPVPALSARVQVTYHGAPLYTFSGDKRKGDAKGEGFKDVATRDIAATRSVGTPSSGAGGYGGAGCYGY